MREDSDDKQRVVTRSEERLEIHTEWRPRARYRFGKRIVREERVERLELCREEFYFAEAPISALERLELSSGLAKPEDNPGEADGDLELILYREEIVISKRVIPYERILVRRGVAPGLTTVHDQVRREQIDVDRGIHT